MGINQTNNFENWVDASDQTLSPIRFLQLICCSDKILHQTSYPVLMGHASFDSRNYPYPDGRESKQILLCRNHSCCSGPNSDGTFMHLFVDHHFWATVSVMSFLQLMHEMDVLDKIEALCFLNDDDLQTNVHFRLQQFSSKHFSGSAVTFKHCYKPCRNFGHSLPELRC